MKTNKIYYQGFCAKTAIEGSGTAVSIFITGYVARKQGDEFTMVILPSFSVSKSNYLIYYIGAPYPNLAETIQKQFVDIYGVIPTVDMINKLLKDVNFI